MKRTIVAGLALVLTLGAVSASDAQQTRRGARGGDQMAMLFKDIDLTDQQKEQLKALREKQGPRGDREGFQARRAEMRELREKGDTAAIRQFREEMRGEMQQRHTQMLQDVRSILTPAQREQFEKNVAAMQEKMQERREHMQHRMKERHDQRR
jgi:protein CpxP